MRKLKFNEVIKEDVDSDIIVYDLTVKDDHSYCIGNNNIIVHNCTTSENGAIGYPMASLIYETSQIKKELENSGKYSKLPLIVADGGMKNYSDVIKALALGSDLVMAGSLFNKAIESAGYNYLYGIKINNKLANYLFKKGFPIKKHFRGMSTKGAQKAMGKTSLKTSEGVTRYRNVEYTLSGWVENFEHYLRSAMSYCDATTLEEFIGQAKFIKITDNSFKRFNK
jgi:glutamate synthase domain-containing protein 2